MFISIVIAVIFAIIVILLYPSKKKLEEKTVAKNVREEKDTVEKNDGVIEKHSLKMMSYEEALEASKQFIYNITRAVMQKFTPSTQEELMDLGKKLYGAGVEYLHVVDVFALSVEKSKTRHKAPPVQKKSIGRQ
jgi:cytochrome c-type biogenesis protein CcmH/NrfG